MDFQAAVEDYSTVWVEGRLQKHLELQLPFDYLPRKKSRPAIFRTASTQREPETRLHFPCQKNGDWCQISGKDIALYPV